LRAAIGVDTEDTCDHPKYAIVRLEPVVITRVQRCRSWKTGLTNFGQLSFELADNDKRSKITLQFEAAKAIVYA
jgi:hypothetical protein